ncbi:MAG: DUF2236 domain-containing protein [Mucilaginibacter polytrichastri]|nr:DUF2236 domain-containing protein [Mucilaginibacter polytrichastri]
MKGQELFVAQEAVIRRIWGDADCVLFIFAASAAEFAVHKAVDWLYFTGKLPDDPLGRLFSTVDYARKIIFSDRRSALDAIDTITQIHASVEKKRGRRIPGHAYRDVLYMLIDYSVRAFELLERPLSANEKADIYGVFRQVGDRMQIPHLPADYAAWLPDREKSLRGNYLAGDFTADLFARYRRHLGPGRYLLLRNVQAMLVPAAISTPLALRPSAVMRKLFSVYKICRRHKKNRVVRGFFMPREYRHRIKALDVPR